MNHKIILSLCAFALLIATSLFINPTLKRNAVGYSTKPYENYFLASQYGHEGEGIDLYKRAVLGELSKMKKNRSTTTPWEMEGPLNTGGRINCIAVHPTNNNTFLIGCADGGIFKTTDGGNTWQALFDNAYALSVSQIVYDNTNSQTVYAGTGDQVLGGYSHIGNGIYKSTNGGASWANVGLTNVGAIAKIVLDPNNANIIYAATTGNPFSTDNNRGLYKSTDAGLTWNQILFLNQNAGIADLVINPQNTAVLYCTGRRRIRSNTQSLLNGTEARIYRSTNGGNTWDTLQNGLPNGKQCRIGLTISNTNPNTVYANYVDTTYNFGGLYKTTDGGNNWSLVNNGGFSTINMGGFGWYFGQVRINPFNNNQIFLLGVDLSKSYDGGVNFFSAGYTHSDKHDLKFLSANEILLATDGGFYKSTDGGDNFQLFNNLPITQLYKVAYNPWQPDDYFAGAQDNGTNFGSSTSGLNNWNWYYGGDGFQPQFDSTDPSIYYAEWQNGNIVATTDGGSSWNDIFGSVIATDRTSWNTPYFVSSFNNNELYAGTYKVYKNTSGPFDAWFPISPDLTDGTNNGFHVITSIHQSKLNSQLLYAGTSDAKVWYTNNGGVVWNQISAGLTNRYVSCVKSSPSIANAVFVSQSGYRDNDTMPHIYYSTNNGISWSSIAGNLPNFPINDVWVHWAHQDSCLMVATDGGIYATKNLGSTWSRVGSNMPIIPVYDIEYNPSNQRIFAGTFARSVQSMHVDSVFNLPVNNPVSAATIDKNIQLTIYPNPVVKQLNIQSTENITELLVYDMYGRKLLSLLPNEKYLSIPTDKLTIGTYILQVRMKEKMIKRTFQKE